MKYGLIFFLILSSSVIIAQEIPFTPKDFYISGDAQQVSTKCVDLTQDKLWQGGSIWYRNPIEINKSFTIKVQINLGCNDELGADGMVFILHPFLSEGYQGEGIGYAGLRPSFGIEMDTYFNPRQNDPFYDHVAFLTNGDVSHYADLSTPVAFPGNINVEDCRNHMVRISWNPDLKRVSITFDGQLVQIREIDLANTVFESFPSIYWGFTSATGNRTNTHKICFESLEMTPIFALETNDLTALINGENYTPKSLHFPSGKTDIPKDAVLEIQALAQFLKNHSGDNIIVNGFTDNSGGASQNLKLSQQRAESVRQALIKYGIPANRIIAQGFGEAFPKEKNNTKKGRKANRRIEIKLKKTGV